MHGKAMRDPQKNGTECERSKTQMCGRNKAPEDDASAGMLGRGNAVNAVQLRF